MVTRRSIGEYVDYQRLYVNFFQPVRKIIAKERVGGRVVKEFDEAATPYHRLVATGALDRETAKRLEVLFRSLNPVKLLGWIRDNERELWAAKELPRTSRARQRTAQEVG